MYVSLFVTGSSVHIVGIVLKIPERIKYNLRNVKTQRLKINIIRSVRKFMYYLLLLVAASLASGGFIPTDLLYLYRMVMLSWL